MKTSFAYRMKTEIQNLGAEPVKIFCKSGLTGENISLGIINAGEQKTFDHAVFSNNNDVVFVGGTWHETKKHEVRLDEDS